MIWHHTKNGQHMVRSGYMALSDQFQQVNGMMNHPCNWTLLWHLALPPKLQVFLWRCFKNILPTRLNLNVRNCSTSSYCPCYCNGDESVDHVLLQCPHALNVWSIVSLQLPELNVPDDGLLSWLSDIMANCTQSVALLLVAVWVCWFI